jgi:hypothetical protein
MNRAPSMAILRDSKHKGEFQRKLCDFLKFNKVLTKESGRPGFGSKT